MNRPLTLLNYALVKLGVLVEVLGSRVCYALRRLKLMKAGGKTALHLNISNSVLWLKQIFNAIVETEEISKFHHYSYH